jgi:hypothetical protein
MWRKRDENQTTRLPREALLELEVLLFRDIVPEVLKYRVMRAWAHHTVWSRPDE